jgi:hypothetical protein
MNKISEIFADGHIDADLDIAEFHKDYVFGMTCETSSSYMQRKLRVLLMRKDRPPTAPLRVNPSQSKEEKKTMMDRYNTLKSLAALTGASFAAQDPNASGLHARARSSDIADPQAPGSDEGAIDKGTYLVGFVTISHR